MPVTAKLASMSRQPRAKIRSSKRGQAEPASYPAWKVAAAKELKDRHDIAPTAIPERVWTNLYVRRLDPPTTADRAEVYYRSIRPAGQLWRKTKK